MKAIQQKMDVSQTKIDANKAKMIASQEWTIVKMDAWLAEMRAWQKETTAGQGATEACLESKEPTSLESAAVHEEVPKKRLQCNLSEHWRSSMGTSI
jgi:hypothetical protein